MQRFRNILVGVDLSDGQQVVGEKLSEPTQEAIRRAVWLAKLNSARLTYLSVLPSALELADTFYKYVEREHLDALLDSIHSHAESALKAVVDEALAEGVKAEGRVVYGRAWYEIVQQALANQHDLVVVGSHRRHSFESWIVGHTGIKLLRKCPCAVWITKPQPEMKLSSVLVATDFSPVCQHATDIAASMAGLQGAQLHILHAVAPSAGKTLWLKQISNDALEQYLEHVTASAAEHLEEEVKRPEVAELSVEPEIHLETDAPDVAIREAIDECGVELLVMGTIARSGLPGLLFGNTAERVLSKVSCSVLVVKPEQFVSPVTAENRPEDED